MTSTPTPYASFRQQNLDQTLTTEFDGSRQRRLTPGDAAGEQALW